VLTAYRLWQMVCGMTAHRLAVACGLVWLVVPAVRAGLKARCALRP
jgi:hypothetical protein